ncbi:hypothetical protein, partial [Escherichia coli]|uniref:hypothetical protein n=1 Tax=Escherichia coli TaxID=562 RepID=UPI0024070445
NCYWFFLPESGSALSGRHRFIPVHVQIVGCGVNVLSDLDSRSPDKLQSVAPGMVPCYCFASAKHWLMISRP